MQLEDYFNFLAPNDIRLKGSRMGRKMREEQLRNPSPAIQRLMKIKAARKALQQAEQAYDIPISHG